MVDIVVRLNVEGGSVPARRSGHRTADMESIGDPRYYRSAEGTPSHTGNSSEGAGA